MNITRENYRSHPALNFSAAKHLLRSPAHFRWQEEHPIEQSSAMVIGTEIHRILTGDKARQGSRRSCRAMGRSQEVLPRVAGGKP